MCKAVARNDMRIDQRLQLPLKRHVPQEVRRVENDRNGLEPSEKIYDENILCNYNSLLCLKSASYENLLKVNTSLLSSIRQLPLKN